MGSPHSNRYTSEFKQRAVELWRESNTTYAEVARGLGIDAGTLAAWVKRADGVKGGGEEETSPFQLAEELRKAKRENERLRKENEILLKASAFFASKQL